MAKKIRKGGKRHQGPPPSTAAPDPDKPLTEKQQRFVEFFTGISEGNATDAARRAGYKGSNATLRAIGAENLTKPNIKTAIREAQKELRSTALMTREERQEWITRVVLGEECRTPAMTMEGPIKDADGNLVTLPPAAKDRIKAFELLGRMNGDFLDRQEHTGKGGGPIQVIKVGDKEIAF